MKRKFKMPMTMTKFFKRKKLRATAVRRPLRIGAAVADYGELAEPSMKLSRALLIVLLLHVVAVTGIIAFNAIKTHQASSSPTVPANTENKIADTTRTAFRAEVAKPRDAVVGKESAPCDD